MNSQDIRDKIRKKRQDLRLSQEDAAALLDCRPGTVQKLEKGPMKVTTEWLERFAKAYGVEPQYFLGDADKKQTEGIPVNYEILGNGKLVAARKKIPPVTEALAGAELIGALVAQPIYQHYYKGDIVLFDIGKQFRPKLCIHRECVIEITRSTRLIGTLEYGNKPDHYTIVPHSGAPVRDTKIITAYRVKHIIRD